MLIDRPAVSRRRRWLVYAALALITFLFVSGSAWANDPTGVPETGKAVFDTLYKGQPMEQAVGNNARAITYLWVAITGFLVFFMQAGFAILEVGLTRAKNAAHTMLMNFAVFGLGALGFYVSGFALGFGGGGGMATIGGSANLNGMFSLAENWGLFGTKGFFLSGGGNYDVGVFLLFLFQLVFMDTAATIPTGAMAERWSFKAFVPYGFLMGAVVYPVFASWVWGGGWLSKLGITLGLGNGYLDFAGSSVVHMVGGITGLVGAWVLGPRIGKFNKDGSSNAIPGHNVPMALLGTIILFFGWFGFNPGSTLSGLDLRFTVIMVNTLLAGCAGMITGMATVWLKWGKPDATMAANGALAGLVAITAPCAFVSAEVAVLIGAIAGVLVVYSVLFIENKLKIDDPCGAISVHGVNGAWGVIALGLFADGTYGAGFNGIEGAVRGLFFGGGASQLFAQLIGLVAVFAWVAPVSFVMFKLLEKTVGLRSNPEDEIAGLDLPEIGIEAYPQHTGEGDHIVVRSPA
jgi:Amt family ammonium transporter